MAKLDCSKKRMTKRMMRGNREVRKDIVLKGKLYFSIETASFLRCVTNARH